MATTFFLLLAIVGALLFVGGIFTETSIAVVGFFLFSGGAYGAWKSRSNERSAREELLRRISELESNSAENCSARLRQLEAAVERLIGQAPASQTAAHANDLVEAVIAAPTPYAPEAEVYATSVAAGVETAPPQTEAPPLPTPPSYQAQREFVATDAAEPEPALFGNIAPPSSRLEQSLDFEQTLGSNWLSKIGIAVLVLGFAFFLAWQLTELGPKGKVLVGVLTSAVLIGVGTYFERSERYRILARAAVAGGWPLLFFVAYAAYFVPAAKIIQSPAVSLGLMMLVGGGMVVHTLRYRSQWVTSLAFLLAFTCVALNHVGAVSLSANVVLAAALVVVVLRMRWYHLEALGVLAVYLNHYYWLRPIIEPMMGKKTVFPEFYASIILLVSYWAVFRASFLLRREPLDERVSVASAILNSTLLLAVLKYQAARPDLAFWGLLALGAAEIGLGILSYLRKQRTSFIVVTTIGCTLCVAAIPFRFTPDQTAPLWLAEAAALLIVGIMLREIVFRRLGLFACGAVAAQLIGVRLARVVGARMDVAYVVSHVVLGIIIAAAVAVFFAVSHIAPRRSEAAFPTEYDRTGLTIVSCLAAVLIFGGSWAVWFGAGAAVAWMAFATLLYYAARRLESDILLWQAAALSAAAIVRSLMFNLPSAKHVVWLSGATERLATVALVIAMLYVSARITRKVKIAWGAIPSTMRWAACIIAMLLAWHELVPAAVALAWTALGLVLFEVAQRRADRELRWQSHAVLASAFSRLFFSNLNIISTDFWRIATVLPVTLALLYVYEQTVREHTRQGIAVQIERYVFFAAAVISFAALLRFEVSPDWVAAVWAGMAGMLLWLSWRTLRPEMMPSSPLFTLLACARGVMHNLYERSYFPPTSALGRWPSVLAPAILLLAALPFAYQHRQSEEDQSGSNAWKAILARPEQTIFFAAFALITALLWTEASKSWLTIAWAAEAVAVFFFAVWLRERSFRLSGLCLLLVCVAKMVVIDVWTFAIRERALTFIALGVGLIAVSVLYTRKREMLREIL